MSGANVDVSGSGIVLRTLEKIIADVGKPKGDSNFVTRMLTSATPAEKALKETCIQNMKKIKEMADNRQFDPEVCVKVMKPPCDSKIPELMLHAIGCLSELMEFGHLAAAGGGKTLLDTVVETICDCSQVADDAVQLKVHDTQLQLAVRTCYSIHLTSKNTVNQNVAKTGLNQMLTSVFGRMEKHFARAGHDADDEEGTTEEKAPSEEGAKEEKAADSTTETTEVKASPDTTRGKFGGAENGAAPTTPSQAQSDDSHSDDFVGHTEVFGSMSVEPDKFDTPGGGKDVMGEKLIKDVILLFRALCKLAMKPLKENAAMNEIPVKTKVLSLELLDSLLKSTGPMFRTSERCVYAVQNYLCMSLIQNSISSIPIICGLTVSIFENVMLNFKHELKTEIGVFFGSMLLRTLDTDNSSYMQKMLVLETIHRFVKDGRTIVELFLNYDCDLESEDLYEKLVNSLSRAAQGVHISNTGVTTLQENRMKNSALESLVGIVTAMSQWTREMEAEAEKHSAAKKKGNDSDDEGQPVAAVVSEIEALESQRTKKQTMNEGLKIFADDPKAGLKYFESQGMVEMTPEAVALFFRNTKGLSKKMIGDYIGRSKDFNKQVLHSYTDSLDFKSMTFDESIRAFLNGFRLPGEACMIDPIMEKFAERYYKDNEDKGIFRSPDAAYVLSYSIMMLNTDQHNPGVKVKMTIDDFARNLRGVNDGQDLPKDFLNEIFTSIRDNEITLKDDDRSWYSMDDQGKQGMTDTKVRAQKWMTESEDAIKLMQNTIKDKGRKKVVYHVASTMQHVRPMFEVTRWPVLSAFSQYLEKASDDSIVDSCLQGFKHAIHIACIFCMSTERDTFISSLSKMTQLMTLRDMKLKHIHAINTLLHVAKDEANYLQSTWHMILTCISQIERLHLMGIGAKQESDFFAGGAPRAKGRPQRKQLHQSSQGNNEAEKEEDERFHPADSKEDAEAVVELLELHLIDDIFINSKYYSSEAIVDFTTCLSLVALEEIHNSSSPRIFCSQKIVEVAHHNMDRIRIVWSRMWQQMSQHFYKAGCHPNLQIAMYAIDSLRQLGIKFLEKPELESYHFQKEFLQPFVLIMQNNATEDVHELLIHCLKQVVDARCTFLKSGWETVLQVLGLGASDSFASICTLGFSIVDCLMNDHFERASEPFNRFTSCLVSYSCNSLDSNIGIKAIDHLKVTTERLAAGTVVPLNSDGKFDASEMHARHWLAVITSLCTVGWDPRTQIRSQALDSIFDALKEHGGKFTLDLWRMIFDRALYPMFDACKEGKVAIDARAREDWLRKSCEGALHQMVDVYICHLALLKPLMEDVLMYIYSVVAQPNLELSMIGMNALSYLIDQLGNSADNEMWDVILKVIKKIFQVSTPREFVNGAIAAAAAEKDTRDSGHDESVNTPSSQGGETEGASNDSASPYGSAADTVTPRSVKMMIPAGATSEWQQPTATQFDAMKLMCTVQLLMINAVGEVWTIHGSKMQSSHILVLVESLEGACAFAHEFNGNRGARTKLWNPELISAPPDLIEQEIQALGVYLNLLFSLYKETHAEVEVRTKMAEERLMTTISIIMERYIQKTLKPTLVPEEVPEMMAFTPVIIQILQGLIGFSDAQLQKHLGQLYLNIVEMINCTKNEARTIVKDLLIRVGHLQGLVQ